MSISKTKISWMIVGLALLALAGGLAFVLAARQVAPAAPPLATERLRAAADRRAGDRRAWRASAQPPRRRCALPDGRAHLRHRGLRLGQVDARRGGPLPRGQASDRRTVRTARRARRARWARIGREFWAELTLRGKLGVSGRCAAPGEHTINGGPTSVSAARDRSVPRALRPFASRAVWRGPRGPSFAPSRRLQPMLDSAEPLGLMHREGRSERRSHISVAPPTTQCPDMPSATYG